MATYDVHLSTEPGKLTAEAEGVRLAARITGGVASPAPAYELFDDNGVVLAVPLDALVAIEQAAPRTTNAEVRARVTQLVVQHSDNGTREFSPGALVDALVAEGLLSSRVDS